jgi:pimeloyl-ACP methyl ester carboxylesterase
MEAVMVVMDAAPPIGRFYAVDGRRLLCDRAGIGGPAVVLLPGAGAVGLDYLNIHERVAEFTTSVLYDRAGTGWSDPVELPRTAAAVTDELRGLLHAADVPPPYLLVGHSLGGVYARRYAQRFPGEVAGLLLLEPAHEDWDAFMPEHLRLTQARPADVQMPELTEELIQHYRNVLAQMFVTWPDPLRELLVDRHLDPEWFVSGLRHGSNLPELFAELRDGGDVPDVPLIVVTAMGIDPGQALFMSEQDLRAQNEGQRALYAAVAASVPRGEHRVLDDAAHSSIHTDQPDAVVQAVRDLLDRTR